MAIKSCRKVKTEYALRDGKRSPTVHYRIVCDSPADASSVLEAPSLPRDGDLYGPDPSVKVTDIDIQPDSSSPCVFTAQVTYGSKTSETVSTTDNPLDAPWEVSYGFTESTEQYFLDCSPKPDDWNEQERGPWPGGYYAVNGAGDRLPDMLEREAGDQIINVGANVATYDPILADIYKNTCNAETFAIDGISYPAGTLKLSPITGSRQTATIKVEGGEESQTIQYWKVAMLFKFKGATWVTNVYDRGLNELIGTSHSDGTTTYALQPIVDRVGLPVKEPAGLNGHGRKLANPNWTPAVLPFRPYKWVDWQPLWNGMGITVERVQL